MSFNLSNKSLSRLEGVHPHLVTVVKLAITLTDQDFLVLEGLRTVERQKKLVARGASTTMNSRHIKAANGYGHAVDLAPYPISWDWARFYPIADAMKKAASQLGTTIEWGGDWKSFKDGPHFQLPRSQYE